MGLFGALGLSLQTECCTHSRGDPESLGKGAVQTLAHRGRRTSAVPRLCSSLKLAAAVSTLERRVSEEG